MTPLLLVKVKRGYVLYEIEPSETLVNTDDLQTMQAFDGLQGPYGGTTEGVFGALKAHFEPSKAAGETE